MAPVGMVLVLVLVLVLAKIGSGRREKIGFEQAWERPVRREQPRTHRS